MKKALFFIVILLSGFSAFSQSTTATATYTSGDINGDPTFNNLPGTSSCPGALSVTVPMGALVTGVDVAYDMTSNGTSTISIQRSWVRCITTGVDEAGITNGPSIFTPGTQSYSRANLSIANGVTSSTTLDFEIHAGLFGFGACNTNVIVDDGTWVITVHYMPPLACPSPSSLTSSNKQPTSVDLNWTTGGATNWDVIYGAVGFDPNTSGTMVSTTTNPHTLTGLTQNTTYHIYVRDNCGTGNESFWLGPITVTTPCGVYTTPFIETFDQNPLSACWVTGPAGSEWVTNNGIGFPSPNGGANGVLDHTGNGGFFAWADASFPAINNQVLISPFIDASALTSAYLRFYVFSNNTFNPGDNVTLFVDFHDGAGWNNNVHSYSGDDPSWLEQTVDLSSYTITGNVRIRFRLNQTTSTNPFQNDFLLDDVELIEAPTCAAPSNLVASNPTNTSIDLSWTTGGATNWQIEYGPAGFTQGSGTIIAASTNPFTVNSLSPATTYQFYVRDSCGVSDVSFWIGPLTANTSCGTATAPYTETFSTNSTPACWSNVSTPPWLFSNGSGFPSPTFGANGIADHTGNGGFFAWTDFSFPAGSNIVLRSPLIDVSTLTVPYLTYWTFSNNTNNPGDNVTLIVQMFDGVSWVTVDTYSGDDPSWLEHGVDLSAFPITGSNIRVRFVLNQTTSSLPTVNDFLLDDITIDEAPSCIKPSALISTGVITNTAVELDWTTGGASAWQIEYGPTGFSNGTGTILGTTTKPFTVSSLSANTTYDFYVRDSCAAGNVSDWVGPITITTLCNPFTAPFSETFNTNSTPACWDNSSATSTVTWLFSNGTGFPVPQGGAAGIIEHTGNGGFYAWSDGSSFPTPNDVSLTSPLIDVSTLTTPYLSFWVFSNNTNNPGDNVTLTVDVFDGTAWNNGLITHSADDPAWQELTYNLSLLTITGPIQIRITNDATTATTPFFNDFLLDDITVDEAPNCPKPLNLMASNPTANSIDLSWTTGGASNWQIEYGAPGFTQGTGTILAVPTNPFTVLGLSSSTTYDFYLRDSCGVGDVSDWIGPISFTTLCLPALAPFTETFDNSTWVTGINFNNANDDINICWTRSHTTPYFWGTRLGASPSSFTTGPTVDHTTGSATGKYIYTESTTATVNAVTEIESPEIDLTPLTVPELRFWYHMFGNTMGTLRVDVWDGTSWTNGVHTITGQQQTATTDPWQEAIVNIQSYANQTIKVRFTATNGGFNSDIAIDDFDILEAPTCPQPSNLMATGATDVSIDISWTTGGATNWQVEYGPTGFTPGTGTIIAVPTNPFTIPGLTAATTYDIYIRDSCGVGDVSAWVGPITHSTDLCATPCTYTIDMTDSFGDGWNGASVDIQVGGVTTNFTVPTGTSGSGTFQVCTGLPIDVTWNNGTFDTEVGFVIKDFSGNVIHSQGSNPPANVFSGTGNCGNPNCPIPSNVVASNPTVNSVDLSWTTGGATIWEIEYGPSGFTSGTGTVITATTNPFTVPGLSPSTTYDFYVRDSCAVGNVSAWAGPTTFATVCAVVAAPYTENFDGAQWVSGTGFANAGDAIDPCWTRSHTAPYFWGTRTGATGSPTTGPNADHTSGAGNYIYTESSVGATVPPTEIVSVPIDLTSLTVPELRFWYHMFGNSMGSLSVDVNDGSTWTNGVFTLAGQQQTAATSPWQEAVVNLSAFAGDTVTLRFTATFTGFNGDMAIDDVSIMEAPNCPQPSNIVASNPTASSIDLSWTTGGATNWQIEYGPAGFTLGTGTILAVSTNPFTVPGLSSSTTYDFYVRDSCGVGDVSVWIGPTSLSTACVVAAAPLTENFDNTTWTPGTGFNNAGDAINPCWTRSHTTPYFWGTMAGATTSATTGPSVDHTVGTPVGKYVYTESSGATAGAITEIESPLIDLTTLTTPELRFWYHMFGTTMGTLRVDIWDGTSWTNGVFTKTGQQQTATTDPWEEAIVNIQAYASDTIKVRFTATHGGFNSDMAIDDFAVQEAPNCPQPSNLMSTGATDVSIDISWLTGGASNWQIEYGPTGFTPGTGTILAVPTNPFTIPGLTAATTYDIYIRDSCGVGDVSAWVGPISVSTDLCAAPCIYTIDMTDSFGDGWNGGSVDIQVGGVTTNFTLPGGNAGAGFFQVCTGLPITLTWNPGTFDAEVGFVIKDFAGNVVHTQGPNPPTNVFTGVGNCGSSTCPSPTFIMASNPTVNSVDLSWTTGGATNWQIEYGPAGFTPGSGTIIAVPNNPFTVPGLSASTTYDFYVRDSCGVGDVSVFVGPVTFSTTCSPVGIPFTEDFEGPQWVSGTGLNNVGDAIDACWSRNPSSPHFWGTRAGSGGTSANTGPDVDHTNGNTTSKYAYTEASGGANGASADLETPPIDLSTSIAPELKFWYHMFGNTMGTLNVDIWDGTAWTTAIFSKAGQQQATGLAPWDSTVIDLTAYVGDTIVIRFNSIRGNGFFSDMAIDDVSVTESSNCLLPTPDFSFTITGTTVDFDAATSTNVISYDWDYDDGSTNGSGVTSSNTYANGGTYDVTLYVTGNCGDLDSITKTVNVPCAATVASFTNTTNGLGLDVDATGSTNASTWSWDYGDGNTGTGTVANHNYTVDGTYTIKLVTENLCGDKDSTTVDVTVCDTNFTAAFTQIITGDTINVDASGVTNATSVSWDFGDGAGTGTGSTSSYVYPAPGIYDVKVVVENLCGDKDSTIKSIEICGPPVAHFNADVLSIKPGSMIVQFDGTQSKVGTLTYTWNFGDGSAPVTGPAKPQHTYSTPNLNFMVTLTVTNSCGDTDVITLTISQAVSVTEFDVIEQSVLIYPNPSADVFTIDITVPESAKQDLGINVINALGQRIYVENLEQVSGSIKHRLDLGIQPKGVYILQIITTKGVINKRITLQ